jgi:excisionase family DNA binding protein
LASLGVYIHMKHISGQTSLPLAARVPPPAADDASTADTTQATLDELMTADQVATLLLVPISTVTVMDYARRGVLPSIKLGKHRRFVRSAMKAALEDLAQRR